MSLADDALAREAVLTVVVESLVRLADVSDACGLKAGAGLRILRRVVNDDRFGPIWDDPDMRRAFNDDVGGFVSALASGLIDRNSRVFEFDDDNPDDKVTP